MTVEFQPFVIRLSLQAIFLSHLSNAVTVNAGPG
jgi:hypothetical protein